MVAVVVDDRPGGRSRRTGRHADAEGSGLWAMGYGLEARESSLNKRGARDKVHKARPKLAQKGGRSRGVRHASD